MEDTTDTTGLIGATELMDARDRVNEVHAAGGFDLIEDCARIGFDAEGIVPVAQNYMEWVVKNDSTSPLPLLLMTAFCMGAHIMASALHEKNSAE